VVMQTLRGETIKSNRVPWGCRSHKQWTQVNAAGRREQYTCSSRPWRAKSPIVWKGSARSMARSVTPRLTESPYVSSGSTVRHASALQR
jgi:hypothetical protein